jgi:hypothetical protein
MASTQSTLLAVTLAAPTPGTFTTATTGGTLASSTTYYYRVSGINAGGETLPNTETSKATGAGTETNTVTVKWSALTGATGYRIYGRSTGAELFMAEVGAVTEWTDDGSVTPAGAMPTVNTSGRAAATSTDLNIGQGEAKTIGIFTDDAGGIPASDFVRVYVDTPSADLLGFTLSGVKPVQVVTGPCTVRAKRPVTSVNIGVFAES